MIVEDCEEIDDNEHIIYVNGKCQNNDAELEWLMHDFFCKDPQDMHYMVLAERVRYFKENKNEVETMCRIMQEVRDEGKAEGLAEGEVKEKYASARRALAQDLPVEVAAKVADLPVDIVRKIAEQERGKSGSSL